MVTIPARRLAELEEQVTDLQARLAKRNNSNLGRLRAYAEANPEKMSAQSAARAKRYKEAHREEYNARRRELRRLKKEAAATSPGATDAVAAPS